MVRVSREIENRPSNSKSPGASHRIAIGRDSLNNAGRDLPVGTLTIVTVAAEFNVGKARERETATMPVEVSGADSDSVTLQIGGSQKLRVRFERVKVLDVPAAVKAHGIDLGPEARLPALTGTEGQIVWARRLREEVLVQILADEQGGRATRERTAERLAERLDITEAKTWIEARRQ